MHLSCCDKRVAFWIHFLFHNTGGKNTCFLDRISLPLQYPSQMGSSIWFYMFICLGLFFVCFGGVFVFLVVVVVVVRTLSQVTSFIGSFFKRLLHTCAGLSLCVSHRCVRIAFCLPRLHHHTSLSWCLLCQHYYWRARRRIRTLLFLLMGSYYTYTWALPHSPLRLSLCVPGFLS